MHSKGRETGPRIKEKVDPSLLTQIRKECQEEQTSREVEVFIKTAGEIGPRERAGLGKKGAKVSSVLGDIAVARIPLCRTIRIASLDFVVYIEKAKKTKVK